MSFSSVLQPDKGEDLIQEYLAITEPLRHLPITLLELGIFKGGSLDYWSRYFTHPSSRIVGVDLVLPLVQFATNVSIFQCDQNDALGLRKIAERYGPFDLVIDDASHRRTPTKTSFDTLFPYVAVGGYYAIEDWAVGYWRDQPQYAGMVQFVAEIVQEVPTLSIDAMKIILAPGKAIALFRRGAAGWNG